MDNQHNHIAEGIRNINIDQDPNIEGQGELNGNANGVLDIRIDIEAGDDLQNDVEEIDHDEDPQDQANRTGNGQRAEQGNQDAGLINNQQRNPNQNLMQPAQRNNLRAENNMHQGFNFDNHQHRMYNQFGYRNNNLMNPNPHQNYQQNNPDRQNQHLFFQPDMQRAQNFGEPLNLQVGNQNQGPQINHRQVFQHRGALENHQPQLPVNNNQAGHGQMVRNNAQENRPLVQGNAGMDNRPNFNWRGNPAADERARELYDAGQMDVHQHGNRQQAGFNNFQNQGHRNSPAYPNNNLRQNNHRQQRFSPYMDMRRMSQNAKRMAMMVWSLAETSMYVPKGKGKNHQPQDRDDDDDQSQYAP